MPEEKPASEQLREEIAPELGRIADEMEKDAADREKMKQVEQIPVKSEEETLTETEELDLGIQHLLDNARERVKEVQDKRDYKTINDWYKKIDNIDLAMGKMVLFRNRGDNRWEGIKDEIKQNILDLHTEIDNVLSGTQLPESGSGQAPVTSGQEAVQKESGKDEDKEAQELSVKQQLAKAYGDQVIPVEIVGQEGEGASLNQKTEQKLAKEETDEEFLDRSRKETAEFERKVKADKELLEEFKKKLAQEPKKTERSLGKEEKKPELPPLPEKPKKGTPAKLATGPELKEESKEKTGLKIPPHESMLNYLKGIEDKEKQGKEVVKVFQKLVQGERVYRGRGDNMQYLKLVSVNGKSTEGKFNISLSPDMELTFMRYDKNGQEIGEVTKAFGEIKFRDWKKANRMPESDSPYLTKEGEVKTFEEAGPDAYLDEDMRVFKGIYKDKIVSRSEAESWARTQKNLNEKSKGLQEETQKKSAMPKPERKSIARQAKDEFMGDVQRIRKEGLVGAIKSDIKENLDVAEGESRKGWFKRQWEQSKSDLGIKKKEVELPEESIEERTERENELSARQMNAEAFEQSARAEASAEPPQEESARTIKIKDLIAQEPEAPISQTPESAPAAPAVPEASPVPEPPAPKTVPPQEIPPKPEIKEMSPADVLKELNLSENASVEDVMHGIGRYQEEVANKDHRVDELIGKILYNADNSPSEDSEVESKIRDFFGIPQKLEPPIPAPESNPTPEPQPTPTPEVNEKNQQEAMVKIHNDFEELQKKISHSSSDKDIKEHWVKEMIKLQKNIIEMEKLQKAGEQEWETVKADIEEDLVFWDKVITKFSRKTSKRKKKK